MFNSIILTYSAVMILLYTSAKNLVCKYTKCFNYVHMWNLFAM